MKFVIAVVISTIISGLVDLMISPFAMIWLGVAHSFDDRIPALGFGAVFFLMWALADVVVIAKLGLDISDSVHEALND